MDMYEILRAAGFVAAVEALCVAGRYGCRLWMRNMERTGQARENKR